MFKNRKVSMLTFSILFGNASKWEENASDVAHSALFFAAVVGEIPGVEEPNASPLDIVPFI